MDVKQCFQTAIRNLLANKARLWHAMLGMAIGILGFVLVLTFGSLQIKIFEDLSDEYAPNMLHMFVATDPNISVRITGEDMEQLAADNPEVIKGLTPLLMFDMSGGVRAGDKEYAEADLYGVSSDYLELVPLLQLQEGRFLNDMDISRERKVCVVESDVAAKLFDGDALGKEIKIWGEKYTIVGVLAEVPNYPKRVREVFIPYTNAKKMLGDELNYSGHYDDTYWVAANGAENMSAAQALVKEMLKERTGREEKTVWWLTVSSFQSSQDLMLGWAYGAIMQYLFFAGIVLFIGGAGIMNVMLAAVQARTKEIGIRKAFGATNQDIERQFMLEAVITGLIGGGVGVALGLVGSAVVCMLGEMPLSFLSHAILPILLALVVSVGVGVIFGTYPAKQAAKMEPVAAINSD